MLASISLPDNATLSKVSNLEVLDASGSRVRFGSFYEESKVIVVFIREFTSLYVSQLTSEFEKLPKAFEEGNVDTIVVGCGDWQPIERYSEITGFPSSKIFADPSLGVFHGLGMNVQTLARTPAGEKKASYLTEGALKGSLWSIWRALKTPLLIGKQGNIAQLGGEFVFEPGNRCTFAHRMQHTEDHAEISELLAKAGCHSSTNNSL
ncbi:AhpC/TSA antioxidant enzyme-domain-containing protein [Lentinula aciculospora]|uniref:AhpC/TSA antioxidant enzyme-domain-containing protein n=1 Tax=Lentinula aciculospora TaxID=153920 RepID=A0A9W8ZSS6_9AGAR|nr:AhpC/TSA antioxidant enzyme-domain-containing protein [Lentinula aciculospora]